MYKKKNPKKPVPVQVHEMVYRRLLVLLRAKFDPEPKNFESLLRRLLKGLHFPDLYAFYEEGEPARQAAFISSGLAYRHYWHYTRGKVVTDIFSPGEIVLNPDAFFNGLRADTGLEFIAGSTILIVSAEDMDLLMQQAKGTEMLTIKTLAAMFARGRPKDELFRLAGKKRVERFFELYPVLLCPARKAPMSYHDMASYLNLDPSHFSALVKALYPDLDP